MAGLGAIAVASWYLIRNRRVRSATFAVALAVGPGVSKEYHGRLFAKAAAHTEYTRLLAEHGFFGVCVLLILGLSVRRRFRSADSLLERAIVMSLTAWALLTMSHAAMRVAAPGFIFGLAAATFVLDPPEDAGSSAVDGEP